MKKYKLYISFLVLSLIGLLGCKKNALETAPQDAFTPVSFWKNGDDLSIALTGCYYGLYNVTSDSYIYFDVLTPNAHSEYPWEGFSVFSVGGATPSNAFQNDQLYKGCYTGIGRTNTFLANSDLPIMDEAIRSRMKGEAHFLRAYYYSVLVNLYGGVPLITTPPDISQISAPRSTPVEVIDQVLHDLDTAALVLPLSYSGTDVGRATKGAALALKAKVLLYDNKWDEAATAARAVMDLNQYSLFLSYRGLFLPQNENNNEVIFDVQFENPQAPSSWDTYLGIYDGAFTSPIGWSSIEPTTDFVDDYEMIDGSTWSESNPVADPADKYNNRDPRLDQTLFRKGKLYKGIPYPVDDLGWAGIYTGFSFKKYTIYDEEAGTPDPGIGHSDINSIILRYADILLMYAEATNEESGPTAEVYNAINAVRARAGVPDLPVGLSKDQMRERIHHERRMEFVLEGGSYYFDVRRWGTAATVLNKSIVLNGDRYKGGIEKRSYNPQRDNLWPIPQHEIDNSNGVITQNPNY